MICLMSALQTRKQTTLVLRNHHFGPLLCNAISSNSRNFN